MHFDFKARAFARVFGAALLAATCAPQWAGAQELDRNQVFELQFHLNKLGFNAGRLDGQAGGRTRSAIYRFADEHDTRADLSPAFLALVRAESRSIEGLAMEDGSIDFLVFTDAGTPLILTVERIGRMDQPPTEATATEPAAAAQETAAAIPIPGATGVSFGVEVRLPSPPEGERLMIDQVVSEPRRLADGTIRFTEHVTRHVIPPAEVNPQEWVWRFDAPPDRQAAGWRFALENAGEILLTRTFQVGG